MRTKIKYPMILILLVMLAGCMTFEGTEKNDINLKDWDYRHGRTGYLENEGDKRYVVPVETITVSFGGDILMDSYFADYIKDYGVDYSWSEISGIMKSADLSVVNLETSVSNRGSTKKPVGYGFRSEPYALEGLVNGGIDLVSTANNHILDYGRDALLDTLANLDEYGILQSGSGRNMAEAEELLVIEREGIKFGFMSYNTIIPWAGWEATEDKPGPAKLGEDNKDRIIDLVRINNSKCDILVFMVHWGVEYSDEPEGWQRAYARDLIDAGVDTIIGHHPHVLQGLEIYRGAPIFYSVGNLIFLKMNEDAGHTGIFELQYTKKGFQEGCIHPVLISSCRANLLDDEDELHGEIIDKFSKRSQCFSTSIGEEGEFFVH